MAKPFIIRLLNAEGKVVANSRIITYNDTTSNSSIITAADFVDNSLTGNININCQKFGSINKTFKIPDPSPTPTPTPTPSATFCPTPTPTKPCPPPPIPDYPLSPAQSPAPYPTAVAAHENFAYFPPKLLGQKTSMAKRS